MIRRACNYLARNPMLVGIIGMVAFAIDYLIGNTPTKSLIVFAVFVFIAVVSVRFHLRKRRQGLGWWA